MSAGGASHRRPPRSAPAGVPARARPSRARRRPTAAIVTALLLCVVAPPAAAPAPAAASVSAILANPEQFDGKAVTLHGTMTNLRERVSQRGNAYYTFDLSDGARALRVFSFGAPPCRSGAVTVEGTFLQVKRQGRSTFSNQLDATRVTCR